MNTAMNNMPVAVSSNPVTVKMIAEKLGMNVGTTRMCMRKDTGRMSKEKVELVRKTAEEMGYDPNKARALGGRARWAMTADERSAKAEAKAKAKAERKEQRAAAKAKREADYLLTHNFPSKEAETRRMLYLQSQGVSNADIGKAVGRSYQTVLRRIGKQPDDVTKANLRYGANLRAQKNAHRRLVAADHTVNTYNGMVTELAEVKAKVVLIEGQVKAMLPKVKEAAKISQVKMIEDISDAPSTALQ